MKMRMVWAALFCFVWTAAAACKPQGGGDGDGTGDLVIGGFFSMTGSKAEFGRQSTQGIQLAVDEVNAAGGVNGRQVRFVLLDDQGNGDEAATAVTRLIDVEHATAILGEVASSLSLLGAPIAQRREIPMVSPSSTNTQVTLVGNFIFRVCFIDPFQGYVMARFARDHLHLDRVAILKDVRNDYSIGLADAFREHFTRLGGRIVVEESYNEGDSDFSAQLTTIRGTDPQGLFVPGYYTEVGNIARQARRLGITVPLMGGDGWSGPLRDIGGEDILGSYYSDHFSADNPSPAAQGFIERYRARYGEPPTGLAALGYDAAMIVVDAMRRAAPEITPQRVRDQLEATEGYPAVTGSITFDENRNPVKPAVVLRVDAERDAFVTEIAPEGSEQSAPATPDAGTPAAAPDAGSADQPAAGTGQGTGAPAQPAPGTGAGTGTGAGAATTTP